MTLSLRRRRLLRARLTRFDPERHADWYDPDVKRQSWIVRAWMWWFRARVL